MTKYDYAKKDTIRERRVVVKNSLPQCQILNQIGLFSQSEINTHSVYINIYDVSIIDDCQNGKDQKTLKAKQPSR
jgi:hypothetical protein